MGTNQSGKNVKIKCMVAGIIRLFAIIAVAVIVIIVWMATDTDPNNITNDAVAYREYFDLMMRYCNNTLSHTNESVIIDELLQRKFQSEAIKQGFKINPTKIRIFIAKHNLAIMDNGYYISQSGGKIDLSPKYGKLIRGTEYQSYINASHSTHVCNTTFEVVNKDTITAAIQLQSDGYNPVALNMANQYTPGGGWLSGASAQEEACFRKSIYPISLSNITHLYSRPGIGIGEFGVIYSPDITVFRGEEKDGYELLNEPSEVSFIACAMYECYHSGFNLQQHKNGTREKIRVVLRMAIKKGHDSLIWSAWGSGAFQCPVGIMAQYTKEVFSEPEFDNAFKKVQFAIIDPQKNRNAYANAFK